MSRYLLTILLFLPAIGGIAVMFIRNSTAARWTAFGAAMAALLASAGLFIPFQWRILPVSNSRGRAGEQNVYGYQNRRRDQQAPPSAGRSRSEVYSLSRYSGGGLGWGSAVDRNRGMLGANLQNPAPTLALPRSTGRGEKGANPLDAIALPPSAAGMQLVERADVIRPWHVQYLLGIDGLSLPLVLATTLIFAIVVIASWNSPWNSAPHLGGQAGLSRLRVYFALFLWLETTVLGVLLSLDFAFFLLFLTASSVLLAILAARTGGGGSGLAVSRYAISMLAVSILVLIVLLALHGYSRGLGSGGRGSLDIIALSGPRAQRLLSRTIPIASGRMLFLLLLAAFIIRMAAFPLHHWLPGLYAESAPPISMLVAITLMTTGGYGLLRIAWPLLPGAAEHYWMLCAIIGIAGTLYASLCALGQRDFNRTLAYISVSVMGLFILGLATFTESGLRGSLFTLIAWPLCCATMFFISGVLFDRFGHRNLHRLGGLAGSMPLCFGFACAGFLASSGLPCFCAFIGQLLVVLGIFQSGGPHSIIASSRGEIFALAILACIGLALLAVALLRAMQRIFFGPPRSQYASGIRDLDARETLVMTILISTSFLLGVMPGVFVFGYSNAAISGIVELLHHLTF